MTIQSAGGYLEGSGMDSEGIHVEYFDATQRRHVHMLFDTEGEANEFLGREFPKPEGGCWGKSHDLSGN